ncbi:MAG: hypothetical protein ACM3ZV_14315 [Bacillota bacterium]
MRAYPAMMGTRPLFAFILTIAVLFASALSGSAVASAATMNHDMQMMEMGHCSSMPSMPSKDDGKAPVKSCCIAMCSAAVAVAPSAPAELPIIERATPGFFVPAAHHGYLGEIATPPPRLA